MLWEFFVLYSIGFYVLFGLTIASFLLALFNEDGEWGMISIFTVTVLFCLFGDVEFIKANYLNMIYFLGGYFLIGVVWSLFRFCTLAKAISNFYINKKVFWLNDLKKRIDPQTKIGDDVILSKYIITNLSVEEQNSFWIFIANEYSSFISRRSNAGLHDSISSYCIKGVLNFEFYYFKRYCFYNLVFWPFSIFSFLFKDLIISLSQFALSLGKKILSKIFKFYMIQIKRDSGRDLTEEISN